MIYACGSCGYRDAYEDDPCDDCRSEGTDFCDCVVYEQCDRCSGVSDDEAARRFPHA